MDSSVNINIAPFFPKAGTIYITATPIGNLQDITLRALSVLSTVNFIICEDSRKTSILLQHYGISTKMLVCHDHTTSHERRRLLNRLQRGESAALVVDAGMPMISDPGYRLSTEALECGIELTTVPGASSLPSALSLSGLPSERFIFYGFMPERTAARQQLLSELQNQRFTTVFFETPHRLLACLEDIALTFPNRQLAVLRELTKVHEEVYRGIGCEALLWCQNHPCLKGEIVLILGGATITPPSDEHLLSMIRQMLRHDSVRDISEQLSQQFTVSKKQIYQLALTASIDLDDKTSVVSKSSVQAK